MYYAYAYDICKCVMTIKSLNKNSLIFPDFLRNFPDHFIDNWLSIHIVCKYIRRIPVSEITHSIWYLYCILNAADVTL